MKKVLTVLFLIASIIINAQSDTTNNNIYYSPKDTIQQNSISQNTTTTKNSEILYNPYNDSPSRSEIRNQIFLNSLINVGVFTSRIILNILISDLVTPYHYNAPIRHSEPCIRNSPHTKYGPRR